MLNSQSGFQPSKTRSMLRTDQFLQSTFTGAHLYLLKVIFVCVMCVGFFFSQSVFLPLETFPFVLRERDCLALFGKVVF